MTRKPKVGLALGGGEARGLAHIGVLKDLIRKGEEAAESEIEKIREMVTLGFGRRLFRRAKGVVLGLSKKGT